MVARHLTSSGRASDAKARKEQAGDEAATEPVEARVEPLGPSRGLLLGVVLGAALWLGLVLLIRALL